MDKQAKGIHHISVISGDGQRNAHFYVKALGLRMVMKTVNQDDSSNYHLFYANGSGQPGSSITFFPWPTAVQGKPGSGEATAVSFEVPSNSMGYWAERFGEQGIDFDGPTERFGKQVMRFQDPDRLQLELVFDPAVDEISAWSESTVPAEHGIRGFWGSTLRLVETEATAEVLTTIFGFDQQAIEGNATLYSTSNDIGGNVIIKKVDPKASKNGRGIVHHVAFRAADEEEHKKMRQQVLDMGLNPTEIIDRDFFRSVYFQSPGGVLFEIATDGPGYRSAQDEHEMGQKLYLPEWLEPRREMIEKRLPDITL
jgi:glyoxalase family protein